MNTRQAACLLVPMVLLARAAAADEYQFLPVQAFPGFSIPECYLRGINNSGMAVGTATITVQDAQGNLHGVYTGMTWTQDAEKTPFDSNSYPTGISDTGWVSGLGAVTFLPSGQTYVPPTLPGTFGGANLWAINDSGVAVGSIQTCVCSNSAGLQQVAYVWDAATGARTISVPGAKELVAINNANVAVGNIRASGGVGDAFVYDLTSGQTTILSSVLPQPPAGVVYKIVASDINNSGQVTGYIRENTTGHNIGFVWSAGTGSVLLSPPVGASYLQDVRPASINNAGVVVGVLGYAVGGARPFVYDAAHGVRDLATLTTVAPISFNYWYASAVNDQGWITAYGYTGNGFASAVLKPLATCITLADADHSGQVTPSDIAFFVSTWLASLQSGTLAGDFDNSGQVTPVDVAAFVAAWFGALSGSC